MPGCGRSPAAGESLYGLDEPGLAEVEPDLIVTQALCAVCAVSFDDVRAVAARLPSSPAVISLDPETLDEVLDDLVRLAEATGDPGRGAAAARRAHEQARSRARGGRGAPGTPCRRARVARPGLRRGALGAGDGRARRGRGRARRTRAQVASRRLGRGRRGRARGRRRDAVRPLRRRGGGTGARAGRPPARPRRRSGSGRRRRLLVLAPGPRLVDGVELLAHLLHPGAVAEPPGIAYERLWESAGHRAPSS